MSRRLRTLCRGLFVLNALGFVAASAGVLWGKGVTIQFLEWQIPAAPLTFAGRLVLIGLLVLSMGVIFKGLHHLDRLFHDYASGAVFTTETASQIRQLGITSILWAGVHVLWPLAVLGLTSTRPATSFSLHLDALVVGFFIITISWFMDAAAELREENDLTI